MLTTERAVLITYFRDGGRRQGTGYLVAGRRILTADHCADGTGHRVIVSGQELSATVLVRSENRDVDLAVLDLDAPDLPELPPCGCARVDRTIADKVTGQALGFPRWKASREGNPVTAQVDGYIPTAEGVAPTRPAEMPPLTLRITDQQIREHRVLKGDLDQTDSPWAGMSGSAVVNGRGFVVAVVRSHAPAEGVGSLTLTPIEAITRLPADRAAAFWRALGVAGPDALLPAAEERVRSTYLHVVREMAPQELRDRDGELAELATFCRGDVPYAHWLGGPWAGKSALLSWFVLNPPAGVDVVSFFVTTRLAAQANSDAFSEVLLEQLRSLLGKPDSGRDPAVREAYLGELLVEAGRAAVARGRRLVLVVDGLDLDRGPQEERLPSIASRLPRHPPEGVKVIVTRRPNPPLPGDLPGDHPLLHCAVRELRDSPHATTIRQAATLELDALLESPAKRELLGLVAAAGGGLTADNLGELTQLAPFQVDGLLRGDTGRVVGALTGRGLGDWGIGPAYSFTKDELRATVVQRLGERSLGDYADRLEAWADQYRTRGWPDQTPAYLIHGYRFALRGAISSPAPPDKIALARLITLLDDEAYRAVLRRRRGWDVEYIADLAFLASKSPDRARDLGYRSFTTGFPNSYLRQQLLDLLVLTAPTRRPDRSPHKLPDLWDVVDMLRTPPLDVERLRRLFDLFRPSSTSPARVALILAMGRASGTETANILLKIMSTTERQVAWAAADALISAGQKAPDDEKRPRPWRATRDVIVSRLIGDYSSKGTAHRRRSLYVLSFLAAEEARGLALQELHASDPQVVGWSTKLLASIGASWADVDEWLRTLANIAAGRAQPPWRNEWTQKRLIRALRASQLTALQVDVAREQIQRLGERLAGEPAAGSGDPASRLALKVAVAELDSWLAGRTAG